MDLEKLIGRLNEKEKNVARSILSLHDLPEEWLNKPENVPQEKQEAFREALLEACSICYKQKDSKVRSFLELGQTYALFWKGMYPEAMQYLAEIKKEIHQRDDYPALQLVNQIELHLCSLDWDTENFEGRMDQLIKEYVINTHRSIDMLSRWVLDTKLNRHLINRGASKNIMDTFDYDHLKEDVFVFKNKNSMSVMASYYQLRAEKHLHELDGNIQSLYTANADIVKLMEKHPEQFGASSSSKIYTIYHLGNSALKLGKIDQTRSAIQKIRRLDPKEDMGVYDRDNFSLSLEIDLLLKQRLFEEVIAKRQEAIDLFAQTPFSNEMIKEEHKKFYCLQFGIAYLHSGDYVNAIKVLNTITEEPEKAKMFKDLCGNAFRINCLALLASKQWEEAEKCLSNGVKYWKDTQQFNQLEASLSQLVRRCNKTQGQHFNLEMSKWREDVERTLSDPLEKSSLQNFDLLTWLDNYLKQLGSKNNGESGRTRSA